MKTGLLLYAACIFIVCLTACKNRNGRPDLSFDNYKVADSFGIELAASDPFIEAPVGIDFDDRGRIWVVEMRGFMTDLDGNNENAPSGRISILDDQDHDGYAETCKVFLDSLVLPRSLSLVYGGLLYTAPPFLYFVEINNDKPGKTILVDSTYGEGGSPEAQANGLMMNIDNWIYSANSQYRYQLREGKWLREPTPFRGQFGISKDDFGRLYYNYNTIQLAGDFMLPNSLLSNRYYKPNTAYNKVLTNNQRVYPLHATTVNRGYVPGVLDKDSMLLNVTAACGPMVYRGGAFPEAYNQNAFMCEPQANLVKRNILTFKDDSIYATQAWNDRDFISSTDEGFRPVNLFNGPDGAMYIVDMHRGVMEYRAFATTYYNEGIAAKKLDTLLGAGRILRVFPLGKKRELIPDLGSKSANELVELLRSRNGWLRDRAQQLLINRNDRSVAPALEQMAVNKTNALAAMHALYTLDGLRALSLNTVLKAAGTGEQMLIAHALLLSQHFAVAENVPAMAELCSSLLRKNDMFINLYLSTSLAKWNAVDPATFLPLAIRLARKVPQKSLYYEAIVSSLSGFEKTFTDSLRLLAADNNDSVLVKKVTAINAMLDLSSTNREAKKMYSIFEEARAAVDPRTNGLALYRNNCASCHGADGEGVELVAPPLKGSEFVSGNSSRLAKIILYGLEGPIHINGKLYQFNNTMPTFASNLTNEQIADVIKYLHNAYVSTPVESPKPEQIEKLRGDKTGTLTEKDLLEMNGDKK